ncbi:TetR/AcrR family transcriptional regulator [Nonomuraea fastidiosa]|uniref:TetR/AcrR family transcriptional regulator n=1 Tax=Nonomuraea fastidiosa TaxID=46173 RepID=UPI00366C3532
MTDSKRPGKRERLASAAAQVLHERGVEKTTLADIARAADVPVGNVYYYFKTKDQLIQAAIDEHDRELDTVIAELDRLGTPQERLKGLVRGWMSRPRSPPATAAPPAPSHPSWTSATTGWTRRSPG